MPDAPLDPTPHARTRSGAGVRYVLVFLMAALVIAIDPLASLVVAPPPPPDPATTAAPDAELMTKFGMAAKSLAPSMPSNDFLSQLELEDPAKAPDREGRIATVAKNLRVAIAQGELGGAERAIDTLRAMRTEIDALDPPEPSLAEDAGALTQIYTDGPTSLTPEARDRLIDRFGNLGRVALVFGEPGTNPERAALAANGVRALLAVGVVGLVGILGFLVGCVLLITAIALRASGRLAMRYIPDRATPDRVHNLYLEVPILFLGSFAVLKCIGIAATAVFPELPEPLAQALYGLHWILSIVLLWPIARGVSWSAHCQAMGWTRGRGVVREIFAGIAAYLAFLPLVVAGFIVLIVLTQVLGVRPSHPLVEDLPTASPWELLLLYSLAAIWAPVVEESIFRGAMHHHMRRYCGPIVAALVTAFIFAAIHPQGITTVPALMALAVGFSACREWRSSLIGSVTAHCIHNSVLVGLTILMMR